MATESRPSDPAVTDQAKQRTYPSSPASLLFEEGSRFSFFQAVRLMERLFAGKKPIGYHENPADEIARFHSHVTLSFPPSEIREIQRAPEGRKGDKAKVWVNFMGLAGPVSVMPTQYVSMLSDPAHRKEFEPLRSFLDLFNHRLISLFYRAWEKYHFAIAYERDRADSFSEHLFCLIGMGTPGLQNRLGVSDEILLFYAALLAQRPRSAVALAGILEDYFNVPVSVDQFEGQWFLMNEENLSRIGKDGYNRQLGINTILWDRFFDPQASFRIQLGPLTLPQFRDFLPDGRAYQYLVELTRFFVGEEFNFSLQLILRAEEVPSCILSTEGGGRLGWSMWLKTREFEEDTSQPVFSVRVAES